MEIKKHCPNCYLEKYKIEYCNSCFEKYVSKSDIDKVISENYLYCYQNDKHILNIMLIGMRNKEKCMLYYSVFKKDDSNIVEKLLDWNFLDIEQEIQLSLF